MRVFAKKLPAPFNGMELDEIAELFKKINGAVETAVGKETAEALLVYSQKQDNRRLRKTAASAMACGALLHWVYQHPKYWEMCDRLAAKMLKNKKIEAMDTKIFKRS